MPVPVPVSPQPTAAAPMPLPSSKPSFTGTGGAGGASLGAASAVMRATPQPARAPSTQPAQGPSPATIVAGPVVQAATILEDGALDRVRAIAAALRTERQAWGSLVEHGVALRADAGGLELAYEKRSFLAAQVQDRTVFDAISRASTSVLGAPAKILVCEGAIQGRTLAQITNELKNAALDAARRAAVAHPVVQDAIAIFDAEVKSVKLPGEE